jgi:hypothetical protein
MQGRRPSDRRPFLEKMKMNLRGGLWACSFLDGSCFRRCGNKRGKIGLQFPASQAAQISILETR